MVSVSIFNYAIANIQNKMNRNASDTFPILQNFEVDFVASVYSFQGGVFLQILLMRKIKFFDNPIQVMLLFQYWQTIDQGLTENIDNRTCYITFFHCFYY